MTRRAWIWSTAAVVVIAGLVTWWLWPAGKPAPRARQYLDYTSCLLTDASGLQGPDAAPVWAGMQQASLTTHAKVQYLPVTGAQTVDNATPVLNSLALRHCAQVFAVGAAPAGAARKAAPTLHGVTFVVLDGGPGGTNLTVLPRTGNAEVTAEVSALIVKAVDKSGH